MGFEGVLTRQKCAGKWCATFWDPCSPNLVSQNSQIFNFHDFGNFGYVPPSSNTSKYHPPHPTPPRRFHLMLWRSHFMLRRSHLMLWRSYLLGVPIQWYGVPSYWAFPVTGRSHVLALGTKKVALDLDWGRSQTGGAGSRATFFAPSARPWERPVTGNAQ